MKRVYPSLMTDKPIPETSRNPKGLTPVETFSGGLGLEPKGSYSFRMGLDIIEFWGLLNSPNSQLFSSISWAKVDVFQFSADFLGSFFWASRTLRQCHPHNRPGDMGSYAWEWGLQHVIIMGNRQFQTEKNIKWNIKWKFRWFASSLQKSTIRLL